MSTIIRSYWSEEDDAWLAEAVGVPGTRTHADTEAEARDAARELAAEVTEILREATSLTLDDFARWMNLDERQVSTLAAASPDPDKRRSLTEWSTRLRTATNEYPSPTSPETPSAFMPDLPGPASQHVPPCGVLPCVHRRIFSNNARTDSPRPRAGLRTHHRE